MPSRPAGAPKPDPKAGAPKSAQPKPAAEPSTSAPAPAAGPRKYPKGGPAKPDLKRYRTALEAMLTGNLKSSKGLEKEALKSSGQDFSVDHMADHGTDNFDQDFTLGLLEGKTELVREIQDAIDKIDGKGELPFGVCEACADRPEEKWARGCETCPWIPKGRLDVMPHARLCIRRQEELEDDS
jgi:RNA polymerase-binding transcription factor DksA